MDDGNPNRAAHVTLRIDVGMRRRMDRAGAELDLSRSALMRRALSDFLARRESQCVGRSLVLRRILRA